MNKRTRHILFVLNFFTGSLLLSQEYLNEGLYFSSHEVAQEKRTSLNLTPLKPLEFNKAFTLEFKAKFRDKDGYFGNIVKLLGNNETNIGLMANVNEHLDPGESNFWLTVNDSILMRFAWEDIPNGGLDKWIDFGIHFDVPHSAITFFINGEKATKSAKDLSKISDFNIIFGKSPFTNAFINDVCPMSIKHIEIRDYNKRLIRNWILDKHSKNNQVYDEVEGDMAVVENPIWLLDQHLYWNKTGEFQFNNLIGTAKDETGGRIFFVDDKAVYIYSQETQKMDTLVYKGAPYPCMENTLIYNPLKKELWSYSFDAITPSVFSFDDSTWTLTEANCNEPAFWHHNKIISPKDSSLITFGGYGFYGYKSHIKSFKNNRWTTVDSRNDIDPRYLSSSGTLNNDSFLIFGGHGTKSGRQVTKINHYADLYLIDFEDFKVRQLWESENMFEVPMVPVESMVINSSLNSFYTLIYSNAQFETTLRLARIGIEEPKMTLFPNSIPYLFQNAKSKADFFLDKNESKLHALLTYENNVSLHTLSYPPLLSSEVFQKEKKSPQSSILSWILGTIVAIGLGVFIYRKALNRSKETYEDLKKQRTELKNFEFKRRSISAIYLFGGFQTFDKDGNDITALFTPTLKQLFILILLYQLKNEKGISSNKLTELLWYDKIGTSARNNRNVNISKLRILLEKIGNIHLGHENTYWTVEMGDDIFCDYIYVKNRLLKLKEDSSEEEIYKFLKIVSVGAICPDIQTEWMDVFKVSIENKLLDGLEQLLRTKTNPNLLILIADTILKYAPLNEAAITLKCRSLYSMGKKGQAKKSYDSFCKEYVSLLETKFEVSFGSIVD